MGRSIDVTSIVNLSITETLDATSSPASNGGSGAARTFNAYNKTQTLRSSSGTPTPFRAIDESGVSAGADTTIDLTNAKSADDQSVRIDLTGKKLIKLLLVTPSDNVGTVTFKPGASNGYNLFGDASGRVTLAKGKRLFMQMDSGSAIDLPAVAGGAKNITVTVSNTGDQWTLLAVFGT